MMSIIRMCVLLFVGFCLSGCGIIQCKICARKFGEERAPHAPYVMQQVTIGQSSEASRIEPVMVTVTGFGAPDVKITNVAQRQLLAMRASEVDAYRRLAEQVKGVQVSSSTKVIDFVTSDDHIRSMVDSYVRGAKIGTQGITKGGFYETTLTLTLDSDFFNRITAGPTGGGNRFMSGGAESLSKDGSGAKAHLDAATLSNQVIHYDLGALKKARYTY